MKTSNTKVVGALVIGAAIGAGLGILFAPRKGSETRKRLLNKKDDLTDALKEKFDNILEDVKNEVDSVKEKANHIMNNGKAKAEKMKMTKSQY